jgi:GLPGLI family protein
MRNILLCNLFCISFLTYSINSLAQITISEGTLCYTIHILKANKPGVIADSATTNIYLKGGQSRTDFLNSLGSESTILDARTGAAVILKQYSGQKLMITLTKENFIQKNSKYSGLVFTPTNESMKIGDFNCKKATTTFSNGTIFTVYYTNEWNVFNKEYDPMFKNLPGLPVRYQFEKGNLIFQYTLTSVEQNPIAANKFEIPKSGYRIMTYEENVDGGQ